MTSKWAIGWGLSTNQKQILGAFFLFNQPGQNYNDLTRPGPPKCSLVRGIPLFQKNLGWWNIIVWPDACFFESINYLLSQWLTFWTFGDSIFSRENKPFKLFFRVRNGKVKLEFWMRKNSGRPTLQNLKLGWMLTFFGDAKVWRPTCYHKNQQNGWSTNPP